MYYTIYPFDDHYVKYNENHRQLTSTIISLDRLKIFYDFQLVDNLYQWFLTFFYSTSLFRFSKILAPPQ